jgi:hypothetical protein
VRQQSSDIASFPVAGVRQAAHGLVAPIRHVAPMGRFLLPFGLLVAAALVHLWVRVEHTQASSELRTQAQRLRVAQTNGERLALELSVRAGDLHLRAAAAAYGLVPPAELHRVATGTSLSASAGGPP